MSLLNKEISEFSVQAFVQPADAKKGEFRTVSKADLLGGWSVLFFYPADFTFICPTELEDLANLYGKFKEAGCEIYGVSCDTHFVHKAWHESSEKAGKINYPMLADPTGSLARDLEVFLEQGYDVKRICCCDMFPGTVHVETVCLLSKKP